MAATAEAIDVSGQAHRRARAGRLGRILVPVLSVLAGLVLWELVSRTGTISQRDLPAMSSTFSELWSMVQTEAFWRAFGDTVRGWAIGLGLATVLAVPIGIALGQSDLTARAFRIPIEFLRPIPSAALIPLLFLTIGTNLNSEIFLATFGAFWPLLVQTMYGVRDVDPLLVDTARSFGVGRRELLYRITLPSAVPYIMTGLRISSTIALILAFTAELFMGLPGLGQLVNYAQAYGLNDQLYALALATGFLGVAIHFLLAALERRALKWHPSQRARRCERARKPGAQDLRSRSRFRSRSSSPGSSGRRARTPAGSRASRRSSSSSGTCGCSHSSAPTSFRASSASRSGSGSASWSGSGSAFRSDSRCGRGGRRCRTSSTGGRCRRPR